MVVAGKMPAADDWVAEKEWAAAGIRTGVGKVGAAKEDDRVEKSDASAVEKSKVPVGILPEVHGRPAMEAAQKWSVAAGVHIGKAAGVHVQAGKAAGRAVGKSAQKSRVEFGARTEAGKLATDSQVRRSVVDVSVAAAALLCGHREDFP
jgi:hypothetical protein